MIKKGDKVRWDGVAVYKICPEGGTQTWKLQTYTDYVIEEVEDNRVRLQGDSIWYYTTSFYKETK